MALGLYRLRRVFRVGVFLITVGGKGAVLPPLPYSLLPLPNSTSHLWRLPEESGSTSSLHHQQSPNYLNLHLTSRWIAFISLGHSEANSVFERNLHPQLHRSRLRFLHLRAICLLLLRIPTTRGAHRLADMILANDSWFYFARCRTMQMRQWVLLLRIWRQKWKNCAPNVNKEWRCGDAGNSMVTLPEEGQQRGGVGG